MTAIHNRTTGAQESVPKPPPGHSETCCNGQAHGQGVLPLVWPHKPMTFAEQVELRKEKAYDDV